MSATAAPAKAKLTKPTKSWFFFTSTAKQLLDFQSNFQFFGSSVKASCPTGEVKDH